MNNLNVNSALLKANLFEKKEKKNEAKQLYIKILKKFPKNQRALEGLNKLEINSKEDVSQSQIDKLFELYNKGYMNAVEELSHELVKNTHSNYLVWNIRGGANISMKNYKSAESAFREAIKISPKRSETYNNLGIALKEQNKIQEALYNYEKAITLQPTFCEAYNNIGVLFQSLKKYDKSIPYFKKTVTIQTNYSNGYNNLGISLKEIGHLEEASKNFETAIYYNPNHSQAHCNLGIIQIILKKFDDAISNLLKSISLNPRYESAYNNLGIAYKEKKMFKDAMSSFKRAISLKPDYYQVFNNIASMYHNTGDYENAISYYKKAVIINPNYHQAQHMLDSLSGKKNQSAPADYVIDLFDGFAKTFEDSLTKKLSYNVPYLIKEQVLQDCNYKNSSDVLDLGCGTGLVGKELFGLVNKIEGIDLSLSMLSEAERKGVYNQLTKADIFNYLSKEYLNFDYYIAADVFIYVGDISKIFETIKAKNKKNGKLIFSTEIYDGEDFKLEKSGRFSHSHKYIKNLCNVYDYNLDYFKKIKLRKEKKDFIAGGLYKLSF